MSDPGTTQAIRVLDVLVIGPLMIYAAESARGLAPVVRAGLVGFGATTIAYNAIRFAQVAAMRR